MDSTTFLKATDLYNRIGLTRKSIESLKFSRKANPQALTIQFKPGTIHEVEDKALSDRILLIMEDHFNATLGDLETQFKSL